MSDKKSHLDRAERNEKLASVLAAPYWDWAVTATFYAAVHYVEAYFATKIPPLHSGNHPERNNHIQDDAILKTCWRDYREMKNQAVNARYYPHIPMEKADVLKVGKKLATVKNLVVPLL